MIELPLLYILFAFVAVWILPNKYFQISKMALSVLISAVGLFYFFFEDKLNPLTSFYLIYFTSMLLVQRTNSIQLLLVSLLPLVPFFSLGLPLYELMSAGAVFFLFIFIKKEESKRLLPILLIEFFYSYLGRFNLPEMVPVLVILLKWIYLFLPTTYRKLSTEIFFAIGALFISQMYLTSSPAMLQPLISFAVVFTCGLWVTYQIYIKKESGSYSRSFFLILLSLVINHPLLTVVVLSLLAIVSMTTFEYRFKNKWMEKSILEKWSALFIILVTIGVVIIILFLRLKSEQAIYFSLTVVLFGAIAFYKDMWSDKRESVVLALFKAFQVLFIIAMTWGGLWK